MAPLGVVIFGVGAPVGATQNAIANCPAGKVALGGGFSISNGGTQRVLIDASVPNPNAPAGVVPTGWFVTATVAVSGSGGNLVTAVVVCTP